MKRCRNCGRPMADNEGMFCSSRCADEFEERHPGLLEEEDRQATEEAKGCLKSLFLAVIIIPLALGLIIGIWLLLMRLGIL